MLNLIRRKSRNLFDLNVNNMKKVDVVIGELFFIAVMLILSKVTSMVLTQANMTPVVPDPPMVGALTSSNEAVLTNIKDQLALREYNITFDSSKHALQSPNRRHNLRTYYHPGKISVKARIDTIGTGFELNLVNQGIYADGRLLYQPSPDAVVRNQGDTLRFHHEHFCEEFSNTEDGIRQTFIVADAPAKTKTLAVKLAAKGLLAKQSAANELAFYTVDRAKSAHLLSYSDLKCWDADGKLLPATMIVRNNQVSIDVNVSQAKFPVTIDPIIANGNPANADKILEINQSYAWLGFSVAAAGDVNGDGYSDVLVGAPNYDNGQSDEGAAFLYPGTASGISLAATTLEYNQANAQMGYSVASAGDINKDGFADILVGMPYYDEGPHANQGAVLVYKGSAGGISVNNPYLFKLDQAEANLGISVAMAGDVNGDGYSDMLAGAHQFDNGQANEGVGVIIYGAPNGLGFVNFLECNQADAMMGSAIAGAGDVDGDGYSDVVAGARFYDNGQGNEGAAFIFKGSAAGLITANPTIIESNQQDARLGHAVSSAGDVNGDGFSDIALGAYMYDKGSNNEGVVMIHYGSANGVSIAPAQILESDQIEAQFGISVACAGDVNGDGYADLIAGSRYYDKGQSNEGAAFIYEGSKDGLGIMPASVLESNQNDAWLGSAVAPAGDVNGDGFSDVLVGSYAYDHGQKDEGSVFVWYGNGERLASKFTNLINNIPKGILEGQSIANAGDVNGDGYNDVIIGTPYKDSKGAAYIYHGSASGLNPDPSTSIENISGSHLLGISVAGAGDLNGDGFDDIIISDSGFFISYDPQKNILIEGAVLIYYGSPQGIDLNTKALLTNTQENSFYGWSVSSAGDINGDGYDDIVIGDPNYDIQFDEGAAFVYQGSAQGIDPNSKLTLTGSWSSEEFGYAVSKAGDINADGFDDIVIGVPFYSSNLAGEGAVVVYYGSNSGVSAANNKQIASNKLNANLGSAVGAAGDVNGDGFADIVAGANNYSNGQDYEGAGMIYYGSATGAGLIPTVLESDVAHAQFGNSVSGIGDLNNDGYSDVIIGSSYSGSLFKSAFINYGSPNGIQAIASKSNPITGLGLTDKDYLKQVVGADINGDGRTDIVGEVMSLYDEPGRIFICLSSSNGIPRNNLRLYNTDLITPINYTQFAQNNFGAGLFAKSFTGRNKGKLVWETRAVNQGFSKGSNNRITNSTQSTGSQNAYASLGTMGAELKYVIDKQGAGTKVRVRVKYDPVLALTGQSYGPWRYLPSYLMGNSTAPVPEEATDELAQMTGEKIPIREFGADAVKVYPNPVSNRLNIDLVDWDKVRSLKIANAKGDLVYQTTRPQYSLDLSSFAEGVYLVNLTKTDGTQITRKIWVRR